MLKANQFSLEICKKQQKIFIDTQAQIKVLRDIAFNYYMLNVFKEIMDKTKCFGT